MPSVLSVFGGAEGLGRLPILIGSGFQFVINTPFSVFVLGHALNPVFPFTNRQGEYGYGVSQNEYNSQQQKKICCAEFMTLTHFSNLLTKNKPPHRLISQFTESCKVHYCVFLYQGIY